MKRQGTLAGWLLFFFVFAGCLKLGPDYRRPALDVDLPQQFQYATRAVTSMEHGDRWWKEFGNPEIDRLVEEVLSRNWDLKSAAARILELRTRVVQARARRLPEIDLQGDVDRRQIRGVANERGPTITTYELSVPALFEWDLWGRLARSEEAAWDDLLQAEENRAALAQSLVAEAIILYLEIEAFERRIEIIEQSILYFRDSLSLVERRYDRGLVSSLDVRQARRILAQAEAILPNLVQALGTSQQNLAVLAGRYPRTRPAQRLPQDYFKQLPAVPAGLPSSLLERRPDLRAAEARLKSLNAQIGVAKAARFPTITLTGNYGYVSNELGSLLDYEGEVWNLRGAILLPLFNAGSLKAGQRAAEARYTQGAAEYVNAVLAALAEVETALLIRQKQLQRRNRVLNFVAEARATQQAAEKRYQLGLSDYLTVLDAQQTRVQAEDDLVQVELEILANRVNLYRSLGGSWAQPSAVGKDREFLFVDFAR